jgi:hypothetical protein
MPPPPAPSGSRARSAPEGSKTGSTATPRNAPASSSDRSGKASSNEGGRSGAGSEAVVGSAVARGSRDRNGRPIVGEATARVASDNSLLPIFGPWGRWYPWYSTRYASNYYGYVGFDPWYRYGSTRWGWCRYGTCYDPFYGYYYPYDPFYGSIYGYGGSYGGGYSSSYRGDYEKERKVVGSIRLKVNPDSAKVYIDGALVGTAEEFSGLKNHLELDGGKHQIELRADGYETYSGEIDVEAGKTMTERVSMKKIKKM